jgi:hypothetical protein
MPRRLTPATLRSGSRDRVDSAWRHYKHMSEVGTIYCDVREGEAPSLASPRPDGVAFHGAARLSPGRMTAPAVFGGWMRGSVAVAIIGACAILLSLLLAAWVAMG